MQASLENGLTQVTVYDDVANTITSGVTATSGRGLTGALRISTRTLDDAGRDVVVTGARLDEIAVPDVSNTFDGLGRVVSSKAGDITTNVAFNPDGTPRTTTISPHDQSQFPGDPVAAIRSHDVTGASTNKTLVRGDASSSDRVTGVTRVVDQAGRTTMSTDQAGAVSHYSYTADGLVSKVVEEASGTIARNRYNPVTRLLIASLVTRPGVHEEHRAFEYDAVTGGRVAVFDPRDREATEITYTYDVAGNVVRVAYPDGHVISHTFDVNGRKPARQTSRGIQHVLHTMRSALLVTAVQRSSAGDVIAEVKYDPDSFGRAVRVSRGNGVVTEYTFTSADEIATEHTTDASNAVIFDGSYSYDSHGNLTRKTVTQKHADVSEPVTTPETYRYNAYDQLTSSRVSAGVDAERLVSKTDYEQTMNWV